MNDTARLCTEIQKQTRPLTADEWALLEREADYGQAFTVFMCAASADEARAKELLRKLQPVPRQFAR